MHYRYIIFLNLLNLSSGKQAFALNRESHNSKLKLLQQQWELQYSGTIIFSRVNDAMNAWYAIVYRLPCHLQLFTRQSRTDGRVSLRHLDNNSNIGIYKAASKNLDRLFTHDNLTPLHIVAKLQKLHLNKWNFFYFGGQLKQAHLDKDFCTCPKKTTEQQWA